MDAGNDILIRLYGAEDHSADFAALRKSGGFDILVTHAPARGIHDFDTPAHRGFACFLKLLDRWKPRWHLHGHIHKNYGMDIPREDICGETTVINAFDHYVLEL